jgi:imidazolonepropionase-like amidohydrolase
MKSHLVLLFVATFGYHAAAVADERLGLLCGQLIDGRSDRPMKGAAVLLEGDRIVAVGKPDVIPAGTKVIDLGEATLMPGFIDAHAHPLIHTDSYQMDHIRRSSAYKALLGLKAVQRQLQNGWTSLRIPGDADIYYAHLEIRRVIEEGLFVGPRIAGAGHYISVTGGGGDVNFIAPEQRVLADGLVVDGPDEVRKAIRQEIKNGSDWIKLLVTGAFMSVGDDPTHVHFSPEELRAAVEEAGRRGVPVMAHAHAAEGIKQAVRAGVRSIEHGTFMDDEAIELMVENGVFLVPTIYIGEYYIEEGSQAVDLEKHVELSKKYHREFVERVRKAIRRGVKVVVGSDFGGFPNTVNVREFASLVDAGMTPMQAIQAGTRVGAELLGWEGRSFLDGRIGWVRSTRASSPTWWRYRAIPYRISPRCRM